MNAVQIRPIDIADRKAVEKFIQFAWSIYKGDPHWVPPMLMDIRKLLNPKNSFFDIAQMQLFMAERNGQPVGRIAAIQNNLHNQTHDEKVGFFGFFECVSDQEVANALLDAATDWLRKRGLTDILGPASPSINHEYGLLADGFDDAPRLMMTYNPPYYMNLLEGYGLKVLKKLNAYKLVTAEVMKAPKLLRISDAVRERSKVQIRSINMKKLPSEVELVKYLFNEGWEKNWGAIPFTDKEIDELAAGLKQIADPELIYFAEVDGKPVGFALVMRDYNYIFKQMNGRLFPFNFLKLFTQKKKIEWVRIILLGILPAFRGRGLDSVLYHEAALRAHKLGIPYGEASWILEDNLPMVKAAEDVLGGEKYKVYHVYGKAL